ncbi:MAG: OsmC family protein [Candidatus Thalassarchaeaceae archaeon]|nr:OsmC family protein [Candidatus Thalassarchaeaceae archaeon]
MMLTPMLFRRFGLNMRGTVRWTGEEDLEGETENGTTFPFHTEDSPNPVQMVLLAHGGCSLLDVITGLKHRMENVRACWVELDSDRSETLPRKFTAVRMKYVIEGSVPEKLVCRLIEQSHEKHCSVGAMVTGSGASLDWVLELRE